MDSELARTFLAIVEAGNFNKAAENIKVTQSTVSMRVKRLEDLLGQTLFLRNKSGATLTPSGIQFHRYAENLVRTWQQAVQEVGLSSNYDGLLAIGGQFTLWDRLIVKWIPWMKSAVPDLAIRAEVGLSGSLMNHLLDGNLDLGVMYTPQARPGFEIEELFDENLVLVATEPESSAPFEAKYVCVDWGREFLTSHTIAYPNLDTPSLWVSHGPMGLAYILENGGSGYFPLRLVRSHLEKEKLFLVNDRLQFSMPVYVVYSNERDGMRFQTALQGLRYISSLETDD